MGKYAEYMILGYSLAAGLLGLMVASLYWRYVSYRRQLLQIERYEAEQETRPRPLRDLDATAPQSVSRSAPASEES